MAITNKMLTELLTDLGFERSEAASHNNRYWRHREAGTSVVLPENKAQEPALQADLVSIRTRLDYDGHLDATTFDAFVSEGKRPQSM